jgi:hypothetical protein
MGRGKKRATTATLRPTSPADAVGVVESPSYTFAAMQTELEPIVAELRAANVANADKADDARDLVLVSSTKLFYAAQEVWLQMWEHYHDDRSWEEDKAFNLLTWAVADFCEDLEQTKKHVRETAGSEWGDRLIAAYDAFVAALDGFYTFTHTPTGVRSRVSPLAARLN